LKAEEGDAVAVGAVVCLIDTEGAKPEGSDKSEGSTAEALQRLLLLKRQRGSCTSSDSAAATPAATYASGTPSPAARKF
jgi:2-oxoglutarate dehydrogenase E2 component (dihydrolipoamide succinyltransferase)